MEDRQTIYVGGYPKSGNTWLCRLLGRILDSPVGGSTPQEDPKEIATEGQDRGGSYIIRKGHYRLVSETSPVPVPSPHVLHWRSARYVVFIIRDPRDICVSGAHHWKVSVQEFASRMFKGSVARLPRWDEYVTRWLDLDFPIVTYEELHSCPLQALDRTLGSLGIPVSQRDILEGIEIESFSNRVKHIQETQDPLPLGREYQLGFMRKGIVGDWISHFDQDLASRFDAHFGGMMLELGYVEDRSWWKH